MELLKENVKFHTTGHFLFCPGYNEPIGDVVTLWGRITVNGKEYKKYKTLIFFAEIDNPIYKAYQDTQDGTYDKVEFEKRMADAYYDIVKMLEDQISK